jgi:SAM-dependent methyltransferase
MECRLCGQPTVPVGGREGVSLYRCDSCRFVSGRPAADVSTVDRYRDYYHAPPPPAPTVRYHEWLSRAESQVGIGRLLEIGAGSGGFAVVAKARGWRVDATEVSETGAKALDAIGVGVFVGDLSQAQYPESTFDLAVALEVIEHVPDPRRDLTEICNVLRPGGLALLTTPNYNGLSRHILGQRWRVIAPEHLGYFTPGTLRRALIVAGFSRITLTSRGLDISTWRAALAHDKPATFDPQRSAALRDNVNASSFLRRGKEGLNILLGTLGLGDTLLAWARR